MRAQVHDSQQVPLNDSSRTSPINIQAAAVWTSTVTPQSHLLHRSTSLPVRILLDRRTGESNQDSLVSVRMKFCSALRSSEVEIFRISPVASGIAFSSASDQASGETLLGSKYLLTVNYRQSYGIPRIVLQLPVERA